MSDTITSVLPTAAIFAVAGFGLGTTYFKSLRRGIRLSVIRRAWLPYVLLASVRIVAAALFFTLAVRWGGAALLASFAGFLLARQLAVRAARRLA